MKIGIVGGGIFGVSTAWEAAKRGYQVELFERDELPSPRAASCDISKAIRLEYGQLTHLYAPLVERSFPLWRQAEELSGESFFHNTGVLALARDFSEGSFEHESWKQLREMGHESRILEPKEGRELFPQFHWDKLQVGTYNLQGGWLSAALATRSVARCAELAGARIFSKTKVDEVTEEGLRVEGENRSFDYVVVAAGAWASKLLPAFAKQIRVSRQRMTFYRPKEGFEVPVWIHDPAESGWYGFPRNSDGIVKVALHQRSETVDPEESREIDEAFLVRSRDFVRSLLPGLDPDSLDGGQCCFYTNSPSGDLVVEKVRDGLYLAGLGSGHAFKFGPVLGQLVMDEIEQGEAGFTIKQASDEKTW